MSGPLKLLFCVNQGAGKDRTVRWSDVIRAHFKDSHHQVEILELKGDLERLIRDAIAHHKPDRVVAVGGDGTVNLVATIVGGTGISMGIVPCGSANGMATDLGIPSNAVEALEVAASQEERAMDAILVNGALCLHLSDIGLNAKLIELFERTDSRGMMVYARLSFKVLWNSRKFRVTVKTDKEDLVRWTFMVVLANARKYGTGATINKIGNLSDGLFEVVLVRRYGLLDLWASLGARRRFDPRHIEVVQAREVEIRTDRASHFQIDGDHKGKVKHVHARILPGHVLMAGSWV